MSINHTELLSFIRENRRLVNMLEWEANHVAPRAWGPRLAIGHILENPKRRAKVQRELDKYAKSVGLDGVDLDTPGEGNPYRRVLSEVIKDFRKEWELTDNA